jgi:hypothetical protein
MPLISFDEMRRAKWEKRKEMIRITKLRDKKKLRRIKKICKVPVFSLPRPPTTRFSMEL